VRVDRIVEAWGADERLDVMQQLGVIPATVGGS